MSEIVIITKCPKCEREIDINEYYWHMEFHDQESIEIIEWNDYENLEYQSSQMYPEDLYSTNEFFPEDMPKEILECKND